MLEFDLKLGLIDAIATQLFKIWAVVVKEVAIVRLHLSSRQPLKDLFQRLQAALAPTYPNR